jgi:hypothetical protein
LTILGRTLRRVDTKLCVYKSFRSVSYRHYAHILSKSTFVPIPAADTNQLKRYLAFDTQRRRTLKKLNFNASVEGKRSEIDRHNTNIKSRRESVMRMGEPAACVTPDSEAQAQLHSSGIFLDHIVSFLTLTTRTKLKSGAGRNSVTPWKSSRVGFRKTFIKGYVPHQWNKKYNTSIFFCDQGPCMRRPDSTEAPTTTAPTTTTVCTNSRLFAVQQRFLHASKSKASELAS